MLFQIENRMRPQSLSRGQMICYENRYYQATRTKPWWQA